MEENAATFTSLSPGSPARAPDFDLADGRRPFGIDHPQHAFKLQRAGEFGDSRNAALFLAVTIGAPCSSSSCSQVRIEIAVPS